MCPPHLHLLALSNVLLAISGRWHPDIIEGHLALWLPTENKMVISYLAKTSYIYLKCLKCTCFMKAARIQEKETLTCSQRQW